MRDARDWDIDYVLGLPPGEHDWVEFKGNRLLDLTLDRVDENRVRSELSKQVSALANSSGGYLVYGIEDDESGHSRSLDGRGVSLAVKKNGTKEWLEDIIEHIVEPPIRKLNVYTVEVSPEYGVVIVEVPDSEEAPHQATDKRYYARISGKSKPIGHRFVMDIANRRRSPVFRPELRLVRQESPSEGYDPPPFLDLDVRFWNVGRVLARFANAWLEVPSVLCMYEDADSGYYEVHLSNLHKDLVNYERLPFSVSTTDGISGGGSLRYYVTRYDPVLPRLSFGERIRLGLSAEELEENREAVIKWTIYADNAGPQEGEVRLGDLEADSLD